MNKTLLFNRSFVISFVVGCLYVVVTGILASMSIISPALISIGLIITFLPIIIYAPIGIFMAMKEMWNGFE